MARGSDGLPKVLLRPAMPYPSTLCEQATPEAALQPFQRWSALRVTGLRASSIPFDTPRRTPMLYDKGKNPSSTNSFCFFLDLFRTGGFTPHLSIRLLLTIANDDDERRKNKKTILLKTKTTNNMDSQTPPESSARWGGLPILHKK